MPDCDTDNTAAAVCSRIHTHAYTHTYTELYTFKSFTLLLTLRILQMHVLADCPKGQVSLEIWKFVQVHPEPFQRSTSVTSPVRQWLYLRPCRGCGAIWKRVLALAAKSAALKLVAQASRCGEETTVSSTSTEKRRNQYLRFSLGSRAEEQVLPRVVSALRFAPHAAAVHVVHRASSNTTTRI